MLNPTTNNNDTWFIDSLVISDVVMPNLLYAVEGDWGPYNYTKVVRWPSHYFLAVLRLTKSFESGEFAPGAHDRHRLWDFVGRYEHTVG